MTEKKAEKKADEPETAPGRVDRIDVIGGERRAGGTTINVYPAFQFDVDADREPVEHIAVASNADELVLEVDGRYLSFDPQLASALRRLVTAGTINLNL